MSQGDVSFTHTKQVVLKTFINKNLQNVHIISKLFRTTEYLEQAEFEFSRFTVCIIALLADICI